MSESTESISLRKYRKYKFNCVLSTVCQLCSINIDCIILHLHVSLSKYAPVVHTSTIWIIFCTEANDFLYNMWHQPAILKRGAISNTQLERHLYTVLNLCFLTSPLCLPEIIWMWTKLHRGQRLRGTGIQDSLALSETHTCVDTWRRNHLSETHDTQTFTCSQNWRILKSCFHGKIVEI